jgi:uncharacterized protein YggE
MNRLKWREIMRFLTTLCAAALMAGAAMAQDAATITVVGDGQVNAAPDMATIMLGVNSQAETAKAAMDQTSVGVEALLATLGEAGIAPRDVQTTGLSLNPIWDQSSLNSDPPKVTGFNADNSVTVRVRAIDTLGNVLDSVLVAGANTFNGLTFGLQDPEPRLDEARQAAVADARRKAELIAEAAGVSLGSLASITEVTGMQGPQPMFRREALMSADAVPVAAGETTVTAQVTIVWTIEQ